MKHHMAWGRDMVAWLEGFQTGLKRKLGVAPPGADEQSWLAGYLEGVEPPERYLVGESDGLFVIERIDPLEGQEVEVEVDGFDTRDHAEEFIRTLSRVISQRQV